MIEGFIPEDQRRAIALDRPLSPVRNGTAVFCDIVGFSAISADLVRAHGRRHGAELLHRLVEKTLGQAVSHARKRQGFALSFAGDAVTLWFDAEQLGGAAEAAAQAAATATELVAHTTDAAPRLRLSIVSGNFDRLTLGSPEYGWFELLGGQKSQHLAVLDQLAGADRIVICDGTADLIAGSTAQLSPLPGLKAFVLEGLKSPRPASASTLPQISAETALAWVPLRLRDLMSSLEAAPQDLAALAEIRPIVAVFILISDIDSSGIPVEPSRTNSFLRDLQSSIHLGGGMVLDLSKDAKGTYAPCVFGAPVAHEDDPERALSAALTALEHGRKHGVTLKIGVARGTGLVGLISADARLRYTVLSAAMNRAARLMTRAEAGTALATADLTERAFARFDFVELAAEAEVAPAEDRRAWQVVGKKPETAEKPGENNDRSVLVERDGLMAQVLERLRSDGAVFMVLEGAAGYGKSAVLVRLRHFAEAEGWLWLNGRADNQLRDVAFHVWFPIMRDILDRATDLDLAPETIGVLAWVTGQSAEVPDSIAGLSGSERAVRIGSTMTDALASMGAFQPVILAFDDLQWADTRSLGLLLTVLGSGQPLRVVAARRPGPPSSMEAGMLFGNPGAVTVQLERLSPDGMIALATSMLGARTLSYDLGRLFLDNAAGSPLFVKLICEVLTARQLVEVREGHCTVIADAEHLGRLDFLESEEAAILARFDEMPEGQKQAVRIASLLGRTFTHEALAAALSDPSGVRTVEAELIRSGYVVPHVGQTGAGLQFVQPLVQQAILQSVSFARRAPVSRRMAAFWATGSGAGALSQRAHHLLGATDANERDPAILNETISALEVAAHQAASASASLEASDLLQAAVDLSKRLPDGPETLRQRLHLQAGLAFGLATFRGYGDPSVEAAYGTALDLANESENSPDLAFTIYGMLSFFTARGDYARAMPIARRLHLLAMRFSDLRLASIAHQSRAIIAILRGRVATGANLAARSIEDADRIGDGLFFPHGGAGDFRIFSGTWLALSLAIAGRQAEAEAAYARAFELSETNAFGRGFLKSFCPLSVLARKHATALVYADDIVADAEARGLALFSVVGGVYSGWAAACLGQDDARVGGFLNAKIHIAQAMGLGSFTPWFLALAAEAHLLRGDVDAAEKAIEKSEAMILHSNGSLFSTETTRLHARIAVVRGERDAAALMLEAALVEAGKKGLHLFADRAEEDSRALLPDRAAVRPHSPTEKPSQAASRATSRTANPVPGA